MLVLLWTVAALSLLVWTGLSWALWALLTHDPSWVGVLPTRMAQCSRPARARPSRQPPAHTAPSSQDTQGARPRSRACSKPTVAASTPVRPAAPPPAAPPPAAA